MKNGEFKDSPYPIETFVEYYFQEHYWSALLFMDSLHKMSLASGPHAPKVITQDIQIIRLKLLEKGAPYSYVAIDSIADYDNKQIIFKNGLTFNHYSTKAYIDEQIWRATLFLLLANCGVDTYKLLDSLPPHLLHFLKHSNFLDLFPSTT